MKTTKPTCAVGPCGKAKKKGSILCSRHEKMYQQYAGRSALPLHRSGWAAQRSLGPIVKDAPSSLEAVREQVRYAHDDVVRLLSSGPTTNERISAAERIRSALAALATLDESVRKDERAKVLRELAAEQRDAAVQMRRMGLTERAIWHDATAEGYEGQAKAGK